MYLKYSHVIESELNYAYVFGGAPLCNPMDCNPPGSSDPGIIPVRILEWVATAHSRGSSGPRD